MVKTYPFDVAELLDTPEAQADFLSEFISTGDPAEINHALGVVARARGMTEVARAAGLGRESLYKALRADGNPELATVLKVIEALGLRLSVVPAPAPRRARKAPKSRAETAKAAAPRAGRKRSAVKPAAKPASSAGPKAVPSRKKATPRAR